MVETAIAATESTAPERIAGHRAWVRVSHWVIALGVIALGVTGFFILMVHPRLYWGEAGNDLMPAFLELPISNNHRPEGWQQTVSFSNLANAPVSASRTYDTFNENGWARSAHFLAGWFLALAGAYYVLAGLVTGHARRDLVPRLRDIAPRALWRDLTTHLRPFRAAASGPPYRPLQKVAYAGVAFVALPFMVLTGLTMSPTVAAAYPLLLDVFGGQQSARTLHFFGFAALVLFFVVHVAMVVLAGFRRQLRAMTIGS
jgi:thiosulfate reductase cytochrome b subunit